MRVLIVGCGYVGLPLGAKLAAEGHEVHGVRRSAGSEQELISAGIKPVVADITRAEELERLEGAFDWVVNCVSSSSGAGSQEYRAVYLQGMHNLLARLSSAPPAKLVYTSSTSVYGQIDNSIVTEESATEPMFGTAKILLATEKLLLAPEPKLPAVILRVAGIYGPERGFWFKEYLKNEAKITAGGQRMLNMIHRDDLIEVIINTLQRGKPGSIYNAVDNEPVTQLTFFQWLSEKLRRPLPPFDEATENAGSKRGFSSKRVSNERLRAELGYVFKYPTFREGYGAEIERLTR